MIPDGWRKKLIFALEMRGCRGDLRARERNWAMGETVMVPIGPYQEGPLGIGCYRGLIYVRKEGEWLRVWEQGRETTANTIGQAARQVKRMMARFHREMRRSGRRRQ